MIRSETCGFFWRLVLCLVGLMCSQVIHAQLIVSKFSKLPEPITNNAVCLGNDGQTIYVYSFGGLDSTKVYSGIHQRSYRCNVSTGVVERIADLPDTLGKIASAANSIGSVIYIVGGYHVLPTSKKSHPTKCIDITLQKISFWKTVHRCPLPPMIMFRPFGAIAYCT
ncbi:MAG: hypothetical protein ACI8ZN_002433 [Bacteroidia bacterium]